MKTLSALCVVLSACCPGSKVDYGVSKSALTSVSGTPVVGAVTTSSATIKFRTAAAGDVAIEYASNRDFNNSTTTSKVSTSSSGDYTGSISITGLSSDTMYWHRLVVDDVAQTPTYVQKFKTLAAGNDCKLAFFADVGNVDSATAVYRRGKDDGAVLALQIGDLDHRDPTSLATARAMHRDMKDASKKHGAKFAENILTKMGLIKMWDDHDYCGQDEDRFCSWRSDAWQAFKEHWPTYTLANGSNGLWHSFTCGDAEVFVLDTRSQRDDNTDTDNSSKSMLDGALIADDQKDWLKNGLNNSTKTWKIVVSSVTSNTSARPASDDHWNGGFSTEATEMKNYISNQSITGVVMVSGDIHTGGGVDDGTNSSWDVPELTVAHTNLANGNGSNLGTWSEGVTAGTNGNNGYGFVTISSSSLKLEAKSSLGTARHSLTLSAP